jgi:MFS family permease
MPRGTLVFLATLAFAQTLALIAEFSVSDWGSVLLHQEFHIAVGPNGYAYTAFMLVQLATRLYAPGLIDRLGLQVAIRAFGIVGTIGYVTCLLGAGFASDRSQVATLVLSCLAYAFLGAAVGPMPSAFTTAAGSIPGLPSARALAVTGLIISVGGMIGRVAFAQVAQVVTLSLALTLMGVLVLITVAMTFVLVPARAEQHAIRR